MMCTSMHVSDPLKQGCRIASMRTPSRFPRNRLERPNIEWFIEVVVVRDPTQVVEHREMLIQLATFVTLRSERLPLGETALRLPYASGPNRRGLKTPET